MDDDERIDAAQSRERSDTSPVSCSVQDHLQQAAGMMCESGRGIIPVLDQGGSLVGIISARDICIAAYRQGRPLWHMDVGSTMARPGPSGVLASERGLAHLRSHLAVIRALADHIENFARPQDADGLGQQMVEHMAGLGCRLLEIAASLTESLPANDGSIPARAPSAAPTQASREPREETGAKARRMSPSRL